ncbi:MAG: glycerol-3-phosphate dehydrogenase [Flavobacteriaceae bacterium]
MIIAGGGVNGCGIARDAAGRGFSVLLAEQADLAEGTSSRSTKLVHGGLRYLEQFEFRLVHEALREREVLWNLAPHIVHPLRFVLPHHEGLRPAWMLRLGLFLYDHIGGRRKLPATRVIDLSGDAAGAPLKPQYRKAFEYSDLWVDDTRLVVLNARDAADRGADIRTRCRLSSARRGDGLWHVTLEDTISGRQSEARARLLINATGPWADLFTQHALGHLERKRIRLVQGSHIVVRRLFEHDRCYIFQNADGRIFFAIPYERDFTLIGTTDRDYAGDPATVSISREEVAYLCAGANDYFREPVRPKDVIWAYSGVRSLYEEGEGKPQDATRDYVLEREGEAGKAALINIYGGKITTYRRLAEEVMEIAAAALGRDDRPWTHDAPLPGGDLGREGISGLVRRLEQHFPFLGAGLAVRLAHAYGTEAFRLLGDARRESDLGEAFGHGLHAREAAYLMEREWARTADDVLWRRSKLGLRFSKAQAGRLEAFMREVSSFAKGNR